MPGILRTPTDDSAPPMMGAQLSPPIIPGLTQLDPGTMRSLMRRDMGLDMPMEQGAEAQQEQEPESEQDILVAAGNLFAKASEYPGLQDILLSYLKGIKKAFDQRTAVSPTTMFRMPTPIGGSTESAPPSALLGSLYGGARQ